jgi:hypothetical protein
MHIVYCPKRVFFGAVAVSVNSVLGVPEIAFGPLAFLIASRSDEDNSCGVGGACSGEGDDFFFWVRAAADIPTAAAVITVIEIGSHIAPHPSIIVSVG